MGSRWIEDFARMLTYHRDVIAVRTLEPGQWEESRRTVKFF